ncbi:MAG TPA: sigma-E processing peptidase SpoIIGA [Candidatus Merdenecus merdavium]|nr:sigma-E processing peptidase SpoIIGA [Candidatus Merdenecus merdavium]
MDYLLLMVTRKLLKVKTTYFRMMLGSMVGALGVCLLLLFPIEKTILQIVFSHVILTTSMVMVAYPMKTKRQLVKGVLLLYGSSYLLGGIYQTLFRYSNIGNIVQEVVLGSSTISTSIRVFFAFAVFSYFIVLMGLKILEQWKNSQEHIYEVCLYFGKKELLLKGFKDTGNHLKDPLSGKAVSIMQRESAANLLDQDTLKRLDEMNQYNWVGGKENESMFSQLRYIPYHSIGKKHGLLPALTIDGMKIHIGETEQMIKHPMIGICNEAVSSKGEYEIIINAGLIDD